ncbi:MAG: protein kinase [Anaerolineaceae bacterium]|nr:protein kinase [Anaerolineaceae bacterium]
MQNFVGKQIDRYQILECLGTGGMAVVYKAYDLRLERDVALKLIRTEAIPREQHEHLFKRFEREAKAQAKFENENIVHVYNYGEINGSPYLVMAYLPGGTLKDRLCGPIEWRQAVHWVIPIAQALSYAHKEGFIHRDVKPANILFDEEDQPVLTDFGIAKILNKEAVTLTGTGLGVGTPEYMAPEQWQGKVTKASDQYALGVVLYELITGRKPYTAETPLAVALIQASEPLTPPGNIVEDIPKEIEYLLFKLLAKNPEDRYLDMDHLLIELENLLKDHPIPTRKPTASNNSIENQQNYSIKIIKKRIDGNNSPSGSNKEPGQNDNITAEREQRKHRSYNWINLSIMLLLIIGISIGIVLLIDNSSHPDNLASFETNQNTDEGVLIEPPTEGDNTEESQINFSSIAINQDNLSQVELLTSLGNGQYYEFDLSPDDNHIIISSHTGTWLYRADTLELISQFSDDSFSEMIFTDSNTFISPVYENGALFIGQFALQDSLDIPIQETKIDSESNLNFIDYSSTCNWMVMGGYNGAIEVWDINSSELIQSFQADDVYALSISPDCQWVVTSRGYNGEADLRSLPSSEIAYTLTEHDDMVWDFDFSSNSQYLASTGRDSSIILWEVKTGKKIFQADDFSDYIGQFQTVAFSPDDQYIMASGEFGKAVVIDSETGNVVQEGNFGKRYVTGQFFQNSPYILLGDDSSLWLWNYMDGTIKENQIFDDDIEYIAFNDDGSLLATASTKEINIWDLPSAKLISTIEQSGVCGIAFNPFDDSIAASIYGEAIKIWNLPDNEIIQTIGSFDEESINNWVNSNYLDCPIEFTSTGKLIAPINKYGDLSWTGMISRPDDEDEGIIWIFYEESGLTLALWDVSKGIPENSMDISSISTNRIDNGWISSFDIFYYKGSKNWLIAMAKQISSSNASLDFENDVVIIWDVSSGELIDVWSTDNEERKYDDKYLIPIYDYDMALVVTSENEIITKDLNSLDETIETVDKFGLPCIGRYSFAGEYMLSCNNETGLWNIKTETYLGDLDFLYYGDAFLSPQGAFIVTISSSIVYLHGIP